MRAWIGMVTAALIGIPAGCTRGPSTPSADPAAAPVSGSRFVNAEPPAQDNADAPVEESVNDDLPLAWWTPLPVVR